MATNHYILLKNGLKHAAYNGEKETLCNLPIRGGERGRNILWFQQIECSVCRKSYATSPRRCEGCSDEGGNIKIIDSNDNSVLVPRFLVEEDEDMRIPSEAELYDDVFTMEVERRMRTIIFVQSLYETKGIILTEEEAARKLQNPEFMADMIFLLSRFENETIDAVDELVDVPPELSERVKAMFAQRKNEG